MANKSNQLVSILRSVFDNKRFRQDCIEEIVKSASFQGIALNVDSGSRVIKELIKSKIRGEDYSLGFWCDYQLSSPSGNKPVASIPTEFQNGGTIGVTNHENFQNYDALKRRYDEESAIIKQISQEIGYWKLGDTDLSVKGPYMEEWLKNQPSWKDIEQKIEQHAQIFEEDIRKWETIDYMEWLSKTEDYPTEVPCVSCDGVGWYGIDTSANPRAFNPSADCQTCNGSGKTIGYPSVEEVKEKHRPIFEPLIPEYHPASTQECIEEAQCRGIELKLEKPLERADVYMRIILE
ncbi:hypothetical protein JXC34_01035 [Candidatus Woesearchaeota archaeon]|nr:hypothetical protein [Candidatus Woesearchaeota archaeon]